LDVPDTGFSANKGKSGLASDEAENDYPLPSGDRIRRYGTLLSGQKKPIYVSIWIYTGR
jgi:hypothetical protein